MATVNGSVASSSYQGGWRNIVTYTTSQTDTTFSVTITKVAVESVKHYSGDNYIQLEPRDEYGAGSESVSFAATGQTSQTITRFPDDQEQMASQEWYWYWRYYWTPNKTFTWNKGSVAATKTVSVGAYLNKWRIETDFTTQTINGATSTASFNVTVPALDASYSYTVSLDLNGGTGAASSLTKWYGEDLPLPKPTKEYYSFKGWANSTAPTTVVYQPDVDYQTNAAGSLIAVWEPAIDSAFITNVNAFRADQYGVADDSGTYIKILADWEVKGAKAITVNFTASMDSTPVWTDTATASKSSSEMVKTGTAEWLTSNAASVSNQYTVTVGISADGKTDERGAIVAQAFFTMDVKAGGHGIAFGKPAETDYLFEVDNMDARFGQDLIVAGSVYAATSTPLVPVGTILDFAAATPPTGYLTCNGSAVSRTDYAALFAVIGTTWGAGDGSTTFNLPDFRGRTTIGAGTGTASDATAHALGSKGGTETHKLTASQSGVPAHSHPLANSSIVYNNDSSNTQRMATSGSGTKISVNTNVGLNTYNNTAADASAAHPNMQPFATVTKIIRAL